MKTIYKYQLKITDIQVVTMPLGAEIVFVEIQDRIPCMWAIVNTDNAPKNKVIHIKGTGHEIPDEVFYLGSFQQGPFVGHVFEEM